MQSRFRTGAVTLILVASVGAAGCGTVPQQSGTSAIALAQALRTGMIEQGSGAKENCTIEANNYQDYVTQAISGVRVNLDIFGAAGTVCVGKVSTDLTEYDNIIGSGGQNYNITPFFPFSYSLNRNNNIYDLSSEGGLQNSNSPAGIGDFSIVSKSTVYIEAVGYGTPTQGTTTIYDGNGIAYGTETTGYLITQPSVFTVTVPMSTTRSSSAGTAITTADIPKIEEQIKQIQKSETQNTRLLKKLEAELKALSKS